MQAPPGQCKRKRCAARWAAVHASAKLRFMDSSRGRDRAVAGAPWSVRELVPWVAVCVVLSAYSYFYTRLDLWPQIPFGTFGLVFGGDVVPLVVVPSLLAVFVWRRPLRPLGLERIGARAFALASLAAFAAVLPLAVWFASRPGVCDFYPSVAFPPGREHGIGLAFLWLVHHAPQLLSTEAMMRGFLLFPLAARLGLAGAVALVLPWYVLLHVGKPPHELALAAWAGVVYSLAAWRTRSILPAFAAHWLVAVTVDAICFAQLPGPQAR